MQTVMRSRRWLAGCLYLLMLTAGSSFLFAQGNTETPEEHKTETGGEPDFRLHLINTAIFAALAGYAIWKLAPSFFNARSQDIQKAIKDATGLKMEADFRSSEIDRKMATLPDAVSQMREQARVEMEREQLRRRAETTAELKKIEATLAADIDGLRAEGTAQIRRRATRAALALAEKRLREGEGREVNAALVGDFVHLIEQGKNA